MWFKQHSLKLATQRGFTLVEIVVYVAILSIFLVTVIQFANAAVVSSEKVRTRTEVQQNMRFAMERMVREIRTADDINTGSSTFGSHPGVLSIAHDDAGKDPTVFDVSGGRLRITQGASGPYFLTSQQVSVTNFVLTDLSVPGRTQNIRIALTLEHKDQGSVSYDTSFSYQTAVVVREEED